MTTADHARVQLPRSHTLPAYQLLVYGRALHPELFDLRARRVFKRGRYELETWLMPGLHSLRFGFEGTCVSELLTDQPRVPATGIVTGFLCAGERDYEHRFESGRVVYMTSVQSETLCDNLFASTYEEISELAKTASAVAFAWHDGTGDCLSLIDVQQMNHEVHAHCYHLVANGGLVVRTQTLFEHKH